MWIPLVALVMLAGGRTIVALFPIWILGFWLYKRPPARTLFSRRPLAWALAVASLGGLAVLPTLASFLPADNFGRYFPWGRGPYNRNLVADYLCAAIVAVHLVSVRALLLEGRLFEARAKTIRWLGSLTFPLYLLHYPVLCFLCAISPWAISTASHALFLATGALFATVSLSPLCELLRLALRNQIVRTHAAWQQTQARR